jgi:hypothetical protein
MGWWYKVRIKWVRAWLLSPPEAGIINYKTLPAIGLIGKKKKNFSHVAQTNLVGTTR